MIIGEVDVFAFESNESEDLGDSGDRICGTAGRTITQASNLNTNIKLYSFHDRIVHLERVFIEVLAFTIYIQMTIISLSLIITTSLNYRGKVAFSLFETSFFTSSCQFSKLPSSLMFSHL